MSPSRPSSEGENPSIDAVTSVMTAVKARLTGTYAAPWNGPHRFTRLLYATSSEESASANHMGSCQAAGRIRLVAASSGTVSSAGPITHSGRVIHHSRLGSSGTTHT